MTPAPSDDTAARNVLQDLLHASPLTLVLLSMVLLLLFLVIASWKLLPHLITAQEQKRREFSALDTVDKQARLSRVEGWSTKVHSIPGIVARLDMHETQLRDVRSDIEKLKDESGDRRAEIASLIGEAERSARIPRRHHD